MWCARCQKDLAEYACPDLKERLERVLKSNVAIGPGYYQRICEQAARNEQAAGSQQTIQE